MPFLRVLYQNKPLHNFHKWGQCQDIQSQEADGIIAVIKSAFQKQNIYHLLEKCVFVHILCVCVPVCVIT